MYLTVICSTEQTKEDNTVATHHRIDVLLNMGDVVGSDIVLVGLVPPDGIGQTKGTVSGDMCTYVRMTVNPPKRNVSMSFVTTASMWPA